MGKIPFSFIFITSFILATSCSHSKRNEELSPKDLQTQKIETLSLDVTRVQGRLEEIDARVSSLTDKLEATRILLDNIAGNTPIKTVPIDSTHTPTTKKDSAQTKSVNSNLAVEHTFKKAYKLFEFKKYSEAALAFQQYTETYPNHILAGSAQYYIGEAYYLMKEYKLALNEYEKVTLLFPTTPRMASALVRMAQCYKLIGNETKANQTFQLASTTYSENPSLSLWQSY